MRLRESVTATALAAAAIGCGRTTLLPGPYGEEGALDASMEGDGAESSDGAPADGRGPTPVPLCTGQLSQCIGPEAGVTWTGASVIQCQPEEYVGPWTLVLQRRSGGSWLTLQTQVVEEPGFGATFADSTGPPTLLTYRVCALTDSATALCGASFTTLGPPHCRCEPTSCALNTACDTHVDDLCGSIDVCGPCANGMPCNELYTCCPHGFMSDGLGGCVCAPTAVFYKDQYIPCPSYFWDPVACTCALPPYQDGG